MRKHSLPKASKPITKSISEVLWEEAFISVWIDRSPMLSHPSWVISLDGLNYKQLEMLPYEADPRSHEDAKTRAVEIGRERELRAYFYETDYRVLLYVPAGPEIAC